MSERTNDIHMEIVGLAERISALLRKVSKSIWIRPV